MPAKAAPKGKLSLPKGKAKYIIVIAVVIGGYLLYRHYKAQATTSAGSTSTPAPAAVGTPAPQDSTGGGASGLGSGDLSGLLDALNQEASALTSSNSAFQSIAQTLAANPLTNTNTTSNTTVYYPSTGSTPSGAGGGNTSPPPSASTPSAPPSSTPPPSPPAPSANPPTYDQSIAQDITATINPGNVVNANVPVGGQPADNLAAAAKSLAISFKQPAPKPVSGYNRKTTAQLH